VCLNREVTLLNNLKGPENPTGTASFSHKKTSTFTAQAGLKLKQFYAWLPDISVTGGTNDTLEITVKLNNGKLVALSDLETTLVSARKTFRAPSPWANEFETCRVALCAQPTYVTERALIATPEVTLKTSQGSSIKSSVGWGNVAGFSVDHTKEDSGEVHLTSDQPLILAGVRVQSKPKMGAACESTVVIGRGTTYSTDQDITADRVIFLKEASVRVADGRRLTIDAKNIDVEDSQVVINGNGRDTADLDGRGPPCPNCCNGTCVVHPCGKPQDYDGDVRGCNHDQNHMDNGRMNSGIPGGNGATITIHGTRTGGMILCSCAGGRGGKGSLRGQGKVHKHPKKNDEFECPGDPYNHDRGPAINGVDGICTCPP
jgi:hypothetical protein